MSTQTVIRHLTWKTIRFEGPLNALARGFEKENPGFGVLIDSGRDYHTLRDYIHQQLMSGSKKYSVVSLPSQLTSTYAHEGKIAPIDDYMNDPETGIREKEDYEKICWKAYTYTLEDRKEHIYGVMTDANACIQYDRRDLLHDHGFDDPPGTLDECMEVIRTIHDPPEVYGFLCELKGFYSGMLWLKLLWDMGGDVIDEQTWYSTSDSDPARRALELEMEMHHQYGVPGEEYWDRTDFNEHLGNRGDGALCPSMGGNGMPLNPELSKHASNVRTSRVPGGPEGRHSIMYGVGCAIPSASKHRKHAYKWIEFQQRKGANVTEYCRAGGQPGRNSAIRSPEIQTFPNCRHFQALADTIRNDAREQWKIPEIFEIENIFGEDANLAVLEEKSVGDALADMERRLNKLLLPRRNRR